MICLDNTDTLEGGASVDAVVDYTVHGLVGTTFTNIAQGQLSITDPSVLYTAGAAISIVSVIMVNTHSAAVTVNLYLDPANGATPRRMIPKDLSLGIGYSLHFDGQRCSVLNASGIILKGYADHADSHIDGTDDIQDATAVQKGLATVAQITTLETIDGFVNQDVTSGSSPTLDGTNISGIVAGDVDQVHLYLRKGSAGTIAAGNPIYISGYNVSGWIEVEDADADDDV